MDDLNAAAPYQDAMFYCNTFKRLANDLGLRLRGETRIIITSTNSQSHIEYLLALVSKNTLNKCLQKYTKGKETKDGLAILGFHKGSKSFMDTTPLKICSKVKNQLVHSKTIWTTSKILPHTMCRSLLYRIKQQRHLQHQICPR